VALRGPAVIVARGEVPMSFAKKEAK